jgi:ATP adenylyltransferase
MAYIKMNEQTKKGPTGCVFCDKSASTDDVENLLIFRGKKAFVLMNLYPYNNGHLMVAPYLHTANLSDLDDETLLEIMLLTSQSQQALARAFAPNGYNVGINLGQIAGAGIADHLHQHIVPRWNGDSNFMHVIADTKVLPESLAVTREKIVAAWASND